MVDQVTEVRGEPFDSRDLNHSLVKFEPARDERFFIGTRKREIDFKLRQAAMDVRQLERSLKERASITDLAATEIIQQAETRRSQIIDHAKEEAIEEGNRQKAAALAEIASASNRAREDLRKQVSALAVAGAEKLIRREIDSNAHQALLDELAAEI